MLGDHRAGHRHGCADHEDNLPAHAEGGDIKEFNQRLALFVERDQAQRNGADAVNTGRGQGVVEKLIDERGRRHNGGEQDDADDNRVND